MTNLRHRAFENHEAFETKIKNIELMQDLRLYVDITHQLMDLHKAVPDEMYFTDNKICSECTREEYTVQWPCPTLTIIKETLNL